MSLSKHRIGDMIAEVREAQDDGFKHNVGGRLLGTIRETVKKFGPLRLFISVMTLPFTFFMAIAMIKSGQANEIPAILRYGGG